jgi:hypothetical protein
MRNHHNSWVEELSQSLAKWKRDAEAGYKKDTVMFKSFFYTAEANVVRICLI